MAVTDITPSITYVSDGTAGQRFPILFRLLSRDHLQMYVDSEISADEFSVEGLLTETVTVIPSAVYPQGARITFERAVPYEQQTTFAPGERQPAKRTEDGLDNLEMQIQQLAKGLSSVPQAAPGETPPSGSLKQAPLTTQGQDADGNLVARTAQEEIDHLGIGPLVAGAGQSAQQAAASAASAAAAVLALIPNAYFSPDALEVYAPPI